jgi:hypothetical protein
MSVLKLAVTTARPDTYLEQNFETAGGKQTIVQRIADYIERIISGNEGAQDANNPPSIAISVQGNEVQATGTLIFDSVVATDAFVINGVTFSCVASGATGNQFNVGADDTESAENAAAAINASETALIDGYVTATGAAGETTTGVVTITSAFYGLSGNMTTLVSNDATITASGARLTGGAEDATAQTLSF